MGREAAVHPQTRRVSVNLKQSHTPEPAVPEESVTQLWAAVVPADNYLTARPSPKAALGVVSHVARAPDLSHDVRPAPHSHPPFPNPGPPRAFCFLFGRDSPFVSVLASATLLLP